MNGDKLNLPGFKNTYYFYSIALLCLGYAIFEYFFIALGALSADEFVFARHIYDYTFNLPYRDFPPYKTVLGYYILSIPAFFSHSLLGPLLYIKDEIAIINVACLALTSYWAQSLFDKRAIILTLLAILANQLFLVYSTDLRVDMLTSWVCLFATLSVLQQRLRTGGLLLGIAFLISQKALWFLVAINGAMGICWLMFSRSAFSLRSFISFNSMVALPIALYVAIWSMIATPANVFSNLFYEAYIQAGIDWYLPIYLVCWNIVLIHGPLLFLAWPLTFITLYDKSIQQDAEKERHVFIISFATIAMILFVNYKQAFPYNFVFTLPAIFLLYANFLSWMLSKKHQPYPTQSTILSNALINKIAIYVFVMSAVLLIFLLPAINYLIILYPLMTYGFLFSWSSDKKMRSKLSAIPAKKRRNRFLFIPHRVTLAGTAIKLYYGSFSLFIALGIVYPLYCQLKSSVMFDGSYQRSMLNLAANILEKGDDYVGGIPFFYAKDQPIDGMKNLIGPAIDYLYNPTEKLALLQLPSIYLATTTPEKIINDFERYPIKLIINNYRLDLLPETIKSYIQSNYQHYHGSLYIYAPTIKAKQLSFSLKFTGDYQVTVTKKNSAYIDGQQIHQGTIIHLQHGDHLTSSKQDYRLTFIPKNLLTPLEPKYNDDNWIRMLRAILT